MSKKDLANPFNKERSTVSQSSFLLSYGDDKYSVYHLLKRNNSRLYRSQVTFNDKAMEEKILWKYEKQYYETDSSGHSMAEEAFNEKVEKVNSEKEDFWSNLQPLKSSRHLNPFQSKTIKDQFDTTSNFTDSSFSKMTSSKSTFQTVKSQRKIHRQETFKLKQRIQAKKQCQKNIPVEPEKFSLLDMYKKNQPQQCYGQPTTVTFRPDVPSPGEELKFQHPQSIYVRQEQYFFVPLG